MNENMTNHGLFVVILVTAVVLIVGAVIYLIFRPSSRRIKASTRTTDTVRSPSRPSQEQYSFVRQRVETYHDEMLRYELGLERHRRQASRALLQKLLNGQEEVIAMPILYLNSDKWRWNQQQLQEAVEAALRGLNLSVPPGIRRPTTQAARACEQWAATEAKRRFDEELCSDSQE